MTDVKRFLVEKAQKLQSEMTELNLEIESMAKDLMKLEADLKQVGEMLAVLNPSKPAPANEQDKEAK